MQTTAKFKFALNVLTRAADRLAGALADPAYEAAMTARLGAGFGAAFGARITAVSGAKTRRDGQTADIADLTGEQLDAFEDMERLAAGARRTAKLAFPGEATRLREEFQVGIDTPKTLAAEIDRANTILTNVKKHAAPLQIKGWIAADTALFESALATLSGKDLAQEEALDDRLNLTAEKITAANALYADCLTIQNAARLQYPAKIAGEPAHATERARFLLDEFPPRDRSEPDGGTQGSPTAPPSA